MVCASALLDDIRDSLGITYQSPHRLMAGSTDKPLTQKCLRRGKSATVCHEVNPGERLSSKFDSLKSLSVCFT